MGESNALVGRQRNPRAEELREAAAEKYVEMYGDSEGYVPATFEVRSWQPLTPAGCDALTIATWLPLQVVHMIGWAPADSQPQPLARGSATASFKDLGKITSEGDA